ncbi:DUF421 domain-containing protein [Parvularcula sp. ZS-1/3]|uniref:DUF421 domain-containing protein n=1 Tax=Parvularcula mediterranea TaxID=2732508 RepID=A0A7Y3RJE8_9PROT|nr:YetF domain-containing protein [Parvularcula mediterranea]NNU14760.1 DUF421 domain-containing protein [Parvularcula mediterranea]
MPTDAIFTGWEPIFRTVMIGVLGYIGIIVMFRASGKRTLSKLNMFDFVVTVAFGSILAAMMLSKGTPLLQGLAAIGTLVVLQFGFTWLASRWDGFDKLLKAEPRLLFHDGKELEEAMKNERVASSELDSALRDSSLGSRDEVAAMVLESDGTISVIPKDKVGDGASIPDASQ